MFYASGNAQYEIYLIEKLLVEGYTVKNVILIDRLYENITDKKLINMQQQLKSLYDISVIFCKSYTDYYTKLSQSYNLPIHFVISINYQIMHDNLDKKNKDKTAFENINNLHETYQNIMPVNIIQYTEKIVK